MEQTDLRSRQMTQGPDRTAHRALLSYGIAVLENLDLSHAPDGRYRLFAAPLKIAGGEAAPCRALLLTE